MLNEEGFHWPSFDSGMWYSFLGASDRSISSLIHSDAIAGTANGNSVIVGTRLLQGPYFRGGGWGKFHWTQDLIVYVEGNGSNVIPNSM